MLKDVILYGKMIKELDYVEISDSERIYFSSDDIFFNFICLRLYTDSLNSKDKWVDGWISSSFYGTFSRIDQLTHLALTDGDTLQINDDTRFPPMELAEVDSMLNFLNAIKKIESYFDNMKNGFEEYKKEIAGGTPNE